MAINTPGQAPLMSALSKLGAAPAQAQPTSLKDGIDGIARSTGVPANVLMALDEVAGGQGSLDTAQKNASALADAVAGGMKIEDAITRFAGDEARGRAILERSYDIADQVYGDGAPAKSPTGSDGNLSAGEVAGGLGKDVATGAVRATGSAVGALGVAADEIARFGDDPTENSGPTALRAAGRGLGDAIKGVGDGIAASRSQDYQDKRAGTEIGGSLTDPSSWTLGEDPSLIGLLGIAAEGIGSMAPIVAAPGPRAAAIFGGLMAGGEGADNARQFVEDAAKTLDESGRPEIEKLPVYRDLTADGAMNHAEAVEEIARRAENNAGFRQGLIGSIGGAATNRIMRGAEGWLGQGGRLTRAAKKAAAGSIEEGSQEAVEGIASTSGINDATGAGLDVMEDSFGNFIAGGLAGGGMGAVAGAVGRGQPAEEEQPASLALPAPTDGGTIFMGGNAPTGTPGADGSGTGSVAAPLDLSSQVEGGAAATNYPFSDTGLGALRPTDPVATEGMGIAPSPIPPHIMPPAGPLESIAQELAANTPAPAPEAPGIFPDQKPGGAVRLGDPASGAITDAVFMGETPEGMAQVRVNGQIIDMNPAEFDQARNAVPAIEAARKEAEAAAKVAAKGGSDNVRATVAEDPAVGSNTPDGLGDGYAPSVEAVADGGRDIEAGSPAGQGVGESGMPTRGPERSPEPPAMGGMDVADGAGELAGPLGAALAEARRAGSVTHTTKKGKTLTGFVLQGVSKKEADAIDPYSFRKNGGIFVRSDRADAAQGDGEVIEAPALDGEIITPEDDRAAKEDAARSAGFELAAPPAPETAPWWRDADDDVRAAIIAEAGPKAANQMRKAVVWDRAPEEARRALQEAYGRLYRAGRIENAGTIEAPRPVLSAPQIDTVSAAAQMAEPTAQIEAPQEDVAAQVNAVLSEHGLDQILTDAEKAAIIDRLTREGGDIDSAIERVVIRSVQDAGSSEQGEAATDAPFTDDERAEQSRDFAAPEEGSGTGAESAGRSDEEPGSGNSAGTESLTPTPSPDRITKKNGDPFKDENSAWTALTRRGLALSDYQLRKVDGGYVAEPRDTASPRAQTTVPGPETPAGGTAEREAPAVKSAKGPTWADFDERDDSDPKMPAGYELTSIRRLTKEEAKAEGYEWPAMKAVVRRDRPAGSYKVESGISENSRANAIAVALERAKKGAISVPLPQPSERAEMMAEAMGLDDPYSAGRIQEEADREGWENLAFQFKIEKPGGRHSYAWTDAHGKIIARMKNLGTPKAVKDRRYIDVLSAAIPVSEARFKPAEAFRKAWEAPGEVRAPQKNTPVKGVQIPGLGFLRPGYERMEVNGEPSTTQYRMTDDGFVVLREINRTTVRDPKGRGIFAGEFDVDEAKVDAAIEAARKPEVAANIEARSPEPTPAKPAPKAAAAGLLGSLSQEKQDRAAELKARLAAKARGQASSGLDPEYITLGGELVALYIEAGTKRFGQMLRDFAETTGLTLREAQAPMRAAYNHVRDDMDLNGEDVSDMDDAAAVMAEVRAALAGEQAEQPAVSPDPQEGATIGAQPANETSADDNRLDERDAGTSPEGNQDAAAPRPDSVGGSRSGGGGSDARNAGSGREDRSAGRPGSGADQRGGSGRGAGGTADPDQRQGARNHVIPEGGLALKGGEKTRARNAVKAIETLRTIEREGRPATADERQALSLYGGAGTLAPALPNSQGKIRFTDIAQDLDRLLSDEERATVAKTSQYAFYTAEPVLRNMWNLAMQLGITGGQVFEPGMGVGGFAGTMPKGFIGEYTGIELDHITAKIAGALYPKSNIKHGDFIKTPMPRDFYDLAIGNPPFASTKITADPAYPQGFMIHDYFFAKTLDSVRPGGLLMFVTSAGTMNKVDSKARDYMADRADLVGAIRLPNTAFAENGTQVTTDIIVLRKRHDGEAEADPSWRESTAMTVPNKDGGTVDLAVNRYFQDHPEMILGEQGAFDTLVGGPRIGVRPREGADLAADLAAAVARFPRKVTSMGAPIQMMNGPRDANAAETKAGSYYLKDGELWQFDGTEGKPVQRRAKGQSGMTKAEYDLVKDLIPLRNRLREVYAADLKGEDATKARKALNKAYDDFVAKRGPINKVERSYRRPNAVQMEGIRQQAAEDARSGGRGFDIGSFDAGPLIEAGKTLPQIARARKEAMAEPGYREGDFNPDEVPDLVIESFPNIDAFSEDPENFRLRAIEKYNAETETATKTRVFTENAISMSVQPQIKSPEDALLYLLGETGRIDLDRIAELSNSTPAKVREELDGKIFENPATGEFETRAKYLSGNVRKKLREAREARDRNDAFSANVAELSKVQPDPISRSQIVVPLGAHWFDASLYSEFAKSKGLRLKAEFKPALGIWTVDGDNQSSAAKNAWGTEDMPFADLMRRAMNNKPLRITRTVKESDGSTRSFVDEEATQAANDKAQELKSAFQEWLWSDEARADALEEQYNERFNAEVAPSYDGGYLTTPGVHSDWRWRPHQTAVIARILQTGSTYMAHTVGAGKTSAMIGAGMEARRLGLAKKPWYVVPNHMLVQFATEFQHQYPLANILVADEKRFHGDRRKQFVADAATGEYDAVIITHSGFEKIPASEQAKARVVEGMLKDIREMVDGGNDTGDRGKDQGQQQATLGALKSIASQLGIKVDKEKGVSTAKKIAQILEQAEQRLARLTNDTRKDAVFDFDEIGVDMLFVDEAHLFRKLSFATTNGNIKGIDPQGSQASMDLFIKSRVVDERNPGRGLVLASGTPITNTMAELYSLSRLIQPEALAARGIEAFDAWAATFGEVASELEQSPDGSYKEVSRFSKFVNTPELSLMVRQVMDIVSSADLDQYVTRPALKDGKRSLVVVESTMEQQDYQRQLSARMEAIANRKGPPKKGDDILLSVINDGRLAAIDMRLVDPSSSGEGSKLERLIDNIYSRWKAGDSVPLHGVKPEGGYTDKPVMTGPSTQIVFSTLGIEATKHNPDFSVHRFIKSELVRRGVPESDIVMARSLKSHAHKQRAFNDMNEGKKRILIGSRSIFTGVNAQRRIAAIHNLDPLWYPADDEQRNGRGIRQGNMNPEIEILDYSTKGTYDATMWQMMGRKAAFIEAFYRGDPTQRDMEDLGEASQYEQAKAMTTRDPRILQLTDMKIERDKLRRRSGAVDSQRARLRGQVRSALREAEFFEDRAERMAPIVARVPDLSGENFVATIDGQTFDSRKDAGTALIDLAEAATKAGVSVTEKMVGTVGGFAVEMTHRLVDKSTGFSVRFEGDLNSVEFWSDDPVGMARKLEGALSQAEARLEFYRKEAARSQAAAASAQKSLEETKDFAQAEELARIEDEIFNLESELLADNATDETKESRLASDGETLTPGEARGVNAAASRELRKVGIAGRVRAQVGPGRSGTQGNYRRGVINIVRPDGSWKHTLDHEIIHALRDARLWDKDYGLFTAEEWRALARAARADDTIRRAVERAYPDLSTAAQTEEMVAEFYADWAQGRREAPAGPLRRALGRVRSFFGAVASALRGEGFQDAAAIMERIASGEVGGRGPDGPGGGRSSDTKEQRDMAALRGAMQNGRAKAAGLVSREFWQKSPEMFSNWLTDSMGKNSRFNILGLVPGHPLFAELGKNLSAAQTYLRNKQEMDAMRNEWQARASTVVDRWHKVGAKNREANESLMDLMHRTTLAGIDPSKPDEWRHTHAQSATRTLRSGTATGERKAWAQKVMAEIRAHEETYAALKRDYDALPAEFQKLYRDLRDEYAAMADANDKALIENIETASRIALKRAERRHRQELNRIRDEGLEGAERDEAIDTADRKLAAAQKRAAAGKAGRMASMRAAFEQNRLKGPYFPLSRFGNYFVTVRDEDGKVISFSRFERKAQMDKELREWADHKGRVEHGVLGEGADLRGMVDPKFVSDVIETIGEAGASDEMLDAIWQHWLETLPDQSVRKAQIHRKGRKGFNKDAVRAFSHAMFHGAHQLARLKYGLEMDENLNDAEEQAARQPNPERTGFVVREMRQRHNFTMKPTNNPLVTAGTSLAFVWYLGMSPASAAVNLSQTTIVGVPIMAARFKKAGVTGSGDALWKALQDFTRGKGHTEKSPNLTADERRALEEGYRRGTIDKTQAHDLAAVAESGVEYRPGREKAMRVIGWLFHHTERLNREVTFLANYRLLRADGAGHDAAIEEADALVKKIHFDYQNTARPRVMQGDAAKLMLIFRNFTVNMLYRLFRDTHQAVAGDSKADRLEARNQLVGITLSMMAHAGIKGVWGYGLIMALLGAAWPGADDDDLKDWLQDALLMEGDSAGTAAWNWTMGLALNGVPGNVLGVSLTNRIGMPNLWFQPPRAGTEGQDLWTHYLEQIAGPAVAIPGQFLTGLSMLTDAWGEGNGDNALRGVEKMVPGFVSDVIKPARFFTYGANTYYGDPLIDDVGPLDALRAAIGFTPARLSERYEINNRLKSREREIMDRRKRIQKAIGDAVADGGDIPAKAMRDLQDFNDEFPEYPITPETVRASIRGRARMKERNEYGVSLNPKLNDRLRGEAPPAVYN